jgi:Restriction endonuclease BamHI
MKLVTQEVLIGGAPAGWELPVQKAFGEIRQAIRNVVWPVGTSSFTINPIPMGNGVKPLKNGFIAQLTSQGWEPEVRATLSGELGPGKIDAIKRLPDGKLIAAEWETGNISSSHRALNKMVVGMLGERLAAGFLVLPERSLYTFLTDRVGNVQELRPYFPLWRKVHVSRGVLCVIGIEHDHESLSVLQIPKGLDGMSLVRRRKAHRKQRRRH